jgi:hypothetical protein
MYFSSKILSLGTQAGSSHNARIREKAIRYASQRLPKLALFLRLLSLRKAKLSQHAEKHAQPAPQPLVTCAALAYLHRRFSASASRASVSAWLHAISWADGACRFSGSLPTQALLKISQAYLEHESILVISQHSLLIVKMPYLALLVYVVNCDIH